MTCSYISTSAQTKVVILDSLQANKIINQLVSGDFAKAELKIMRQMDTVSQTRIKTLYDANASLLSAYNEKQLQTIELQKAIDISAKIIRKEQRKKNFYKITALVGLGGVGYLLIRQ